MNIDKQAIVKQLAFIKDPNSNQNILQTMLLAGVSVEGNNVNVSLSLPSMNVPYKGELNAEVVTKVMELYPEANVNVHFLSPDAGSPAPGEKSKPNRAIPQVKNIIAVASGKGGVGKSTVSVNLALGLKRLGLKVGLMDADLYGPSIPTMMNLKGQRPKVEKRYGQNKIIPLQAFDMPVMSIGFILEPEQALVLRGPRLAGIIKQFISECIWPELDYLVIDLPPGTGDIQLTLVQTVPITGAIMVTTPQQLAVADAIKAMNMFRLDNVAVPILGVVENMSWFTPKELPDHKYLLFGKGGGETLAKLGKTKLLGQLPLIQAVGEAGDAGTPIVMEDGTDMQTYLMEVAKNTVKQVNIRNENFEETSVVQIKN
ncbi:MAG: Mrp/NBP35 family ATP-binding protein [Bacteroidota bacterium]